MSHKYFFKVTSAFTVPDPSPLLFIYETENDDENGKYTLFCSDPTSKKYWDEWLERRYFEPARFAGRFGYRGVAAGKIQDDAHLQRLLAEVGVTDTP